MGLGLYQKRVFWAYDPRISRYLGNGFPVFRVEGNKWNYWGVVALDAIMQPR
jgi:hypothetical protein